MELDIGGRHTLRLINRSPAHLVLLALPSGRPLVAADICVQWVLVIRSSMQGRLAVGSPSQTRDAQAGLLHHQPHAPLSRHGSGSVWRSSSNISSYSFISASACSPGANKVGVRCAG